MYLSSSKNTYHGTKFSLKDFVSQGYFKANYSNNNDIIYGIDGNGYGHQDIHALDGDDTIHLNNNNVKVADGWYGPYIKDGSRTTVYAGLGNDKITSSGINPRVVIFGEDGDDIVEASFADVDGGKGNDVIRLDYGTAQGGAGNDTISAYKGTIEGGEGDDILTLVDNPTTTHEPLVYHTYHRSKLIGGDGNDVLTGNSDNNTLEGGAGADSLQGNAGNDILNGNTGNDALQGGDGNDWLDGGTGSDTLIGGLGDDTYIVDEFDTYLEEGKDLEGGYDTIHIASDFDLSANNFEAVTLLGDGNFNVIGDEFDNIITGNIGNNHLMGGAGNDTLDGGDGDDYLDGGTGADTLTGGAGNDYYILDNEFDTVVEHFGIEGGIDTVEQHIDRPFYNFDEFGNPIKTGSYHQLFDNVENLILKGTAKTAFGNDLDNIIILNEQSNFVNALSGNDTIIYQKGSGKDTILSTDNLGSKDSLVIEGYDLSEASFVRVTNTISPHDMLQIRFKGSNDQITLLDYFANEVDGHDNRIDEITFKQGDNLTTLSQSEFESKILTQSQNNAPYTYKYPKPIMAETGKTFWVQFDKDTIKDIDVYDSELAYTITLSTQNAQGHYDPIPDWLSFDPATLTLTGTPPQGATSNLQFILWGKDTFDYGSGAYVTLNIKESATSTAPNPTNPKTSTLIKDTKGDDVLQGDNQDTTFIYTGGQDILTDAGGKDTLIFANGINFDNVGQYLMWQGDDLILQVNGSTANQVTLKNFFANQNSIVETIRFETGGEIHYEQLYALFGKTIPTAQPINDTTTSPTTPAVSPQNNFVGTNKADKLDGTDHHDQLQGKAGHDTLNGKAGNDILIGGMGNDTLIGGAGNDLYYFNKGFGKDTIINTGGGYDNIYFEGISFNQVGSGLVKSGNNLILKVVGANDELTLKDFFVGGDNANLNIHFKEGGSITNTQLLDVFQSTKIPTHTDTEGFNASLEIALGLMEAFKGLNGESGGVI